ncbi:hypothetical protein ACFYY2_10755 [Streptomyces sp. NPDC001822]|uniref:hypothetical protein n=1 Tax=Streptomyces sp. NPDC001822 TaxID=3364614 RepID=UPI00367E30D7
MQVSVTAEAEPGGLGDGLATPDRSHPLFGRIAVLQGIQLRESGSISSPPAVSRSRIGALQDAHAMSSGPVEAQLGKPPTRHPGGIERAPW